jgi:hypothetical protein
VPILQVQDAYSFYKTYILDYSRDKSEIYERYGFSLQGSIGSKDWEVFAAILLDDRARQGDGADLVNYEVKSAVIGGSFEYQYHRNRGLDKLADDRSVDHIFIARSEDYTTLEIWLIDRTQMTPIFDKWLPELQQNYETAERQRFRRSVTHGFVRTHGLQLLTIIDGALTEFLDQLT